MTDTTTKRMISAYNQEASPTMFLSGMFRSPQENFHSSEEVELDIVRSDEDISVVIQDLTTGYRMNSTDIYTNKNFKPPIHKEAISLNAFDMIKRMPGQNPFESPDFRANIIIQMFAGMRKVERKIRRAVELQASQVLTSGVVDLKDSNGVTLYTIDYKPKATHFPTVSNSWSGGSSTKVADLLALANVIRNDGLVDPDTLVMGEGSFEEFISDTAIQARMDTRRINVGNIGPMVKRGNGGQFRGVVEIGNYKYDIWTYGGRFKDPQTGNKIPYIADAKVIMMSVDSRFDATFGAIPNIGNDLGVRTSLIPELPARLSNVEGGMDLFTNVWMSNDGEQLFGGVGARPLYIPTAIDQYGCLTTEV